MTIVVVFFLDTIAIVILRPLIGCEEVMAMEKLFDSELKVMEPLWEYGPQTAG